VALILDAGALIGFDRRNKRVVALLEHAQQNGIAVKTTTGCVAQVWRDGARQARLARLLFGVEERELSKSAARQVGLLLANSGSADVVDGSVIDIAADGDVIVTTDPTDLVALAKAAKKRLTIIPVSA
jgi:ribosomal protein L18